MMCGRYVQDMGTCPVVTLQFHRDPSQGRPRVSLHRRDWPLAYFDQDRGVGCIKQRVVVPAA